MKLFYLISILIVIASAAIFSYPIEEEDQVFKTFLFLTKTKKLSNN